MPWSGRREYDAGMDTAMAEVDAAARALRDAGAKKVVVAGHSMGANAALHYPQQKGGVDDGEESAARQARQEL